MRALSRYAAVAFLAGFGVLGPVQAFADPPARVARIDYLKGSVSFRPASLEEWAPATPNYPMTSGDHLWTDPESWAEMHIGSTAVRLAPSTAFAFLNLDDRFVQMRLSEGALDVRVRNLDGGLEIDTPSAAISLTRPGVYRVDVVPDGGSTRVVVRSGAASVTADGPDFWVGDGEAASIYGTDETVSHEVYRAGEADNWERWCRARDEREDDSGSLRYVSYEMTGYQDLDESGTWTSVPDYGWGWQPRVAVGWSPYRYGQWRWVYPWGWTWVDDAPWGFAPFHYGRWACLRGSWYWFPGRYVVRPVYAPALVAFIGGDHWGLSFGAGRSHVGWFPLAPGEFWMPHYHASHGYIRNANVTTVDVTNINIDSYRVSQGAYVNRAVPGAMMAVPRETFLGGRAVSRFALNIDPRSAMRAEVVGTSAPVAPRADSVVGGRRGYVSRPASTALDRPVVARARPAPAPVPFAAQERALQANGGRPLDDSTLARLRAESGQRVAPAPVRIARGRGAPAAGGPAPARPETAQGGQSLGPATPGAGPSGAGIPTRRAGERPNTENAPPGARGSLGGPATARPETNDRPAWARPRGEGQGGGYLGPARGQSETPARQGQGGGAPTRYGDPAGPRAEPTRPPAGSVAPSGDRPGGARSSDSGNQRAGSGDRRTDSGDRRADSGDRRTDSGDRRADSGDRRTDSGDKRTGSGIQSSRPADGAQQARPRGGEAKPAPQSRPTESAKPRGGRGGGGE